MGSLVSAVLVYMEFFEEVALSSMLVMSGGAVLTCTSRNAAHCHHPRVLVSSLWCPGSLQTTMLSSMALEYTFKNHKHVNSSLLLSDEGTLIGTQCGQL